MMPITATSLPAVKSLRIEAVSLALPTAYYVNRMPFTGVLTKVAEASDAAPNGTGGRRIMLTRAAAEKALPSLLGMGINMCETFNAHNPGHKVGVITEASIDGNDLKISGIIYCDDSPQDALLIQQHKGDLGFSFEASGITVNGSLSANPLVIGGLVFTGASVLFRKDAAYHGTSLAASAAKDVVVIHPVLLKALSRAGYTACEDPADRLSFGQLDALMDGASSIQSRIELKQLVVEAGIWPKGG